jgi:hypothetical protein
MIINIDIVPHRSPSYAIPSVEVILNDHILLATNLNNVNSHGIHTITFDHPLDVVNTLKIIGTDISKDPGDNHGFTIVSIMIDNIDLSYFSRYGTVYRPIYDDSYIDNYIIPNNKLNEISTINGSKFHIESGNYVNYINSSNGFYELVFETPINRWLHRMHFGLLWNRHKVKTNEYNDLNT